VEKPIINFEIGEAFGFSNFSKAFGWTVVYV